jgi:hypothetical protein
MLNPRRPDLALWIALALWSAAALLAWLVHAHLGWVNTDLPHASLPRDEAALLHDPSPSPPDQPRRVILIVIDGLRYDVATEEMKYLQELTKQGELAEAQAPLPSLSRPAYAALVTGTTPDRIGIRTNRFLQPIPVDTVLARLADAQRPAVGGANVDYMSQNFGDAVTRWHLEYHWQDPARTDAALRAALAEGAPLTLLHLRDLDAIAHRDGAGDAYREAARALDDRLRALLANLDLNQDALLITSDHGHLDRGGHGGPEPDARRVPLLLAGRGVARHNGPPRRLGAISRVAPTLSVMLGLPFPRDMSAAPLLESLDPEVFSPPYLDARQRQWRQHRTNYERRWLDQVYRAWTSTRWNGELVGNHVSDAATVPPDASLEQLLAAREETLLQIRRDRRVGRTPLLALLLVPLGVLFGLGALRGHGARPALALPAFGATALAMLHLLELPLSYSAINNDQSFSLRVALAVAAALTAYGAALWALTRPLSPERRRPALRFHFTAMTLTYASAAPLIWLLLGFSLKAPMPSPWLMFLPILTGGVGAGLLALSGALWLAGALKGLTSRTQRADP